MKKISDFTPQKRNANKHTPYGLRLLEKSLREDGFIDAQTAAADGEIISGSARLEKAVEVFTDEDGQEVEPIIVHSDGKRPVIVIRDDIPNAEHPRARRLSVAANKIAQVDFDPDWALLKEWGGEDEQIKKLFSDDEWREGTGDEAPQVDAEPQIDRAAELAEKWHTATGQLWKLGNHRLLIGDCTVRENVERLMGGERADIMVTDPPYGVEYDPSWRESQATKGFGAKLQATGKVENDDICDWREAFSLFEGDVAYVWHAGLRARQAIESLESCNFVLRAQIIWAKPSLTFSRGAYHFQHEPCYYVVRKGRTANWIGDRKQTTLWEIKGMNPAGNGGEEKTSHGTQKPLECMERPIKNHSGDVYEPFAGSGTTIIAAHNLNRRCYAMEISEKYGAVILERFYTATGITPELVTE